MESKLIYLLSSIVGFSCADVEAYISHYSKKYKKFRIPKKNGGARIILHPCQNLKAFQYAAEASILSHYKESSIARAYIKGITSPLQKIAVEHSQFRYTIRIDFKDFFPSIVPNDLIRYLEKEAIIGPHDKEIVQNLFFYTQSGKSSLPVGAPTSPKISNIVMINHDEKIIEIANHLDATSCVSRYADDLYFSTNIKGKCREFLEHFTTCCENIDSPKITINSSKTIFLSRANKRTVCGLFITPQGNVSIGRERKNKVKELLYQYKQKKLKKPEIASLSGLLAFCKDVEPDFFNKVMIKYGSEILKEDSSRDSYVMS